MLRITSVRHQPAFEEGFDKTFSSRWRTVARFGFFVIVGMLFWFKGRADQVVFSELMHAPRDGQATWIEVHNLTATPFDMAEWRLEGKEVEYSFPPFAKEFPGRSFLRPFERILLSSVEPNVLRRQIKVPDSVRILGPWNGRIGKEKEDIRLLDKNGIGLCRLRYGSRGVWPLESIGTGHSLVLQDSDAPIDDVKNWESSARLGGSPGTAAIPLHGIPLKFSASPSFKISELFGLGSTWRFYGSGRELDPSWRRPDYEDQDWATGKGLFGFEDSRLPSPGIMTELRRGHVAYYFRKDFQYSGPVDGVRIEIDHVVDDGAIYYLNGKRIGRIRMRASLPAQSQLATDTVTNAVLEERVISLSSDVLREGRNVLAVQVHQATRTSSDLVFGCRLKVLQPVDGRLQVNRVSVLQGGKCRVEILNESDQAFDLESVSIQLEGDNATTKSLSGKGVLDPGQGFEIELHERDVPDGKLQRVALLSESEGSLLDQLSLAELSEGWTQFRDQSQSEKWFLKPIEAEEFDPSMPRPDGHQVYLTEIEFSTSSGASWVEWANRGKDILPGGLLQIVFSEWEDPITLEAPLAPGEHGRVAVEAVFEEGRQRVLLKNMRGETLAVHEFDIDRQRAHFSRYPEWSPEWYSGLRPTAGAPNQAPKRPTIAINELMVEPAFGNQQGEFVELINFGTQSVDLSKARFVQGIEYRFPAGTRIGAGEYLVLAEDSQWMREAYPQLQNVFEYRGSLKNDGECLRLEDPAGNLIDETCYHVEGDWPVRSAGRGSSLELIHPSMDRTRSSAWADSRIERSSQFQRYEFTGTYGEVAQMGRTSDYRELHFYLVGESHIVIRNIELRKKSGGRNLLPETSIQEADSRKAGWLIQGNHADSFVEGGRLHLIAHGHGDNRANRAEVDVPGLREGQEYTLSFDARWVSGAPRLIAHTWDNSFAHSFRIDVPRALGTPGRRNSRFDASPVPQLDFLKQEPPVPMPGETVNVFANVLGDENERVTLHYREVGRDSDEAWSFIEMEPVEAPTESVSGTSYLGNLNLQSQQGTIVEFYVKASNLENESSYLPRQGQEAPGLIIFDQRQIPSDLRTIRMIVHPKDIDTMLGWDSAALMKYPRLSNQYFNATFVSDERKVYFGAEIRRSGSPWTRRGGLARGKWKLPKDREFRAHGKFSFDDDPERWTRHHNRITRYLLYLLGHPVSENEFVRVLINTDPIMLREDVEPVDADFLNRNFSNGNDGELYRIDDQWWFTDNWRQAHRDASWDFVGSSDPTWYRNAWMKRSREEDDDYSNLVRFFELVSSERYSESEMNRWLDSDQILKMTAVMGFVGDWDSFTQRRGKNAYFYRRADDGRFQFLQWDTDLAFQRTGRSFYGGRRAFVSWVQRPENIGRLRIALMHLDDFCNKNPERVRAWIQAEKEAHPETQINAQMYLDWFARQERNVERFLDQ